MRWRWWWGLWWSLALASGLAAGLRCYHGEHPVSHKPKPHENTVCLLPSSSLSPMRLLSLIAELLGAVRREGLEADGVLLAALLGGESLAELRTCLAEAEIETTPGLSPRVAPMGEIRELGALLQRAGFALPVADSERLDLWHSSPLHLMQEIRAVGESNAMTDRKQSFLRRDTLGRCLALYQERFSRPDGKTRATLEIVTLTGWAPAAGQQQPLRPGSAAARLADDLAG